jgi:hypothetical protein
MPVGETLSSNAMGVLANRLPKIPDGTGSADPEPLRDLTLPLSLATSLSRLFEELGYPLNVKELPERYGSAHRKYTLAERSDTDKRHLVHIPSEILDDSEGQMPIAQLAFAIPSGARAFVLSEMLDKPNDDYWKKIRDGWQANDIDGRFVGWRDITKDLESKARDEQLASIALMFELDQDGTPLPAPAGLLPEPLPDVDLAPPRVFISYSWDSPEHETRVSELAQWLREHGVEAWIDKWETSPVKGWRQWCYDQIEAASFVLVVCTETYKQRALRRQSLGSDGEAIGRGVTWESMIITNDLYEETSGQSKYVPIVFTAADRKHVPYFLADYSLWQLDRDEGWLNLYRTVTQQRAYVPAPLGRIVKPEELDTPRPLGQGAPPPGS